MSGFTDARRVETRAMEVLQPYAKLRSFRGQWVLVNGGPCAEEIQKRRGDMMINTEGRLYGVEVKAEERDAHGRFFFETWSNRAFGRHKPGWMLTTHADFIWYYFLESDALYELVFPDLFRWCFEAGKIYEYPERLQTKHDQINRTYGRCVEIATIRQEVGLRLLHPRAELEQRGLLAA